MARKVNKSQKVRDYLKDHPDEGPTAVADALKRYKISPAFVSNIKNKMNSPNSKGSKRRGRPRKAAGANGSHESILAAAELIKSCGGVEQAKDALKVAESVVTAAR